MNFPQDPIVVLERGDAEADSWCNQTGGYACHQRTATGECEAIGGEELANSLLDLFTSEPWNGWCAYGFLDLGELVATETSDKMDALLAPYALTVDRDLWADSEEAWVHVRRGEDKGILMWGNSD